MKLLVIIGNGGHANVVKDIAKDENFNKILFIRLNIDKNKKDLIKIKKILDKYSSSNIYFTIGIGFNFKRKIISETINKNFKGKFKWKSIISNNSIISNDVKIGKGTIIMPGVVINKGVKIGKHCIVNTSSSIDHDNMISNFVSIAPGVNTSGNVQIGEASHIGINSAIKQNITIGKNVLIGAMTYVNKNCVRNSIVYGVPMQIIGKRHISDDYL